MKLYIKNMVCHRCKLVVENVLREAGITPVHIGLGEVTIAENELTKEQYTGLSEALRKPGFELLDDRKQQLIEQIKTIIIGLVHHNGEAPQQKFSSIISGKLHHDYSYLSNLFSSVEGVTIEQYIISQRIERAKELLAYGELSLGEIAWQLHYSSVAHLSAQFKKVTGMTPSAFKQLGGDHRMPLDHV